MKAIQVLFDEALLERLDQDEAVKRLGRSAVLRQVAAEYLQRRQTASIKARYRQAYADGEGLGEEFAGWAGEGVWPEP